MWSAVGEQRASGKEKRAAGRWVPRGESVPGRALLQGNNEEAGRTAVVRKEPGGLGPRDSYRGRGLQALPCRNHRSVSSGWIPMLQARGADWVRRLCLNQGHHPHVRPL